jgi:hypothetical protein
MDQFFWGGKSAELPGGGKVFGQVWPKVRARSQARGQHSAAAGQELLSCCANTRVSQIPHAKHNAMASQRALAAATSTQRSS